MQYTQLRRFAPVKPRHNRDQRCRYPMGAASVLPEDILSQIFIEGQAMSNACEENNDVYLPSFEVQVSRVSGYWRSVALNTHILWRQISVVPGKSLSELRAYIQRSNTCPVDIEFKHTHWRDLHTAPPIDSLNLVTSHPPGWRRATIHLSLDSPCVPLLTYLQGPESSGRHLEYLSLSACLGKDALRVNTELALGLVQAFPSGTPRLTFVRLRSFAVHFFRPPLNSVTTLHIEIARTIPLQYDTFKQIIAALPRLVNLSLYGEGELVQTWPVHPGRTMELPSLKSLRLWIAHGPTLSRVLIHIHAPSLRSLSLKEVQENDLNLFWPYARQGGRCFPHLDSLTFYDFEFSDTTYHKAGAAFPGISRFSSTHSAYETLTIVRMLGHAAHAHLWPKLNTLSVLCTATDGQQLYDMTTRRALAGIPLSKLRLGGSNSLDDIDGLSVLMGYVEVEIFDDLDEWREGDSMPDKDDGLWE